jgi:hypothetical protein
MAWAFHFANAIVHHSSIMSTTTPAAFSLSAHGLTVAEIHHNLAPSALYEHAIRFEKTQASPRTAR